MTGQIFVRDTLSLKNGCKVNGDLHIRRLTVELDAMFDGNCKMMNEEDLENITYKECNTSDKE